MANKEAKAAQDIVISQGGLHARDPFVEAVPKPAPKKQVGLG